jgi:hypothetical protein
MDWSPAPECRRGVWSSPKETLEHPLWGWNCFSCLGSRMEVLCRVRVYENVTMKCRLVMKWVQSHDLWVCGELIWSRVSLNRASGPRLDRFTMAKTPKSLLGEWPEMEKESGVNCFPLCAREEDPIHPLHCPHPFHFLSLSRYLANGRNGRRLNLRTL